MKFVSSKRTLGKGRAGRRVLCVAPVAVAFGLCAVQGAEVWTYDMPGGERFSSPDYEVTVEAGGKTHRAFVHYSFGREKYTQYRNDGSVLKEVDYSRRPRGMVSHSAAIFSFRGVVTVRIKVRDGAQCIKLPLKSAKVLPSSYHIPCTVEDGDTIVFTLDRPEKVAVIPNYDQAMAVYEDRGRGHLPAQSWKDTLETLAKRESFHGEGLKDDLSEGYKNPLIVLAHPPEENVPDKRARDTLVVQPGTAPAQAEMDGHRTVWFAPGVHDLSSMGDAPNHQTLVRGGQTVYLEGGSYVLAQFKKGPGGNGDAAIAGRGIVSGLNHKWIIPNHMLTDIDRITGITVTDRPCFGIAGGRQIDDIAMIGAWHGNTDGPDHTDNCTITNSFLLAHDDNLKLNHRTHARHLVIWQLANAHPIMVKEFLRDGVTLADSVVEDVDIIAYFQPPVRWSSWHRLAPAAIACLTGTDLKVANFTFRDIRIESPYLFRVFGIYNLDTNQEYTPSWFPPYGQSPTAELRHTRIDGMTFRDIQVRCPLIAYRSLIGSAYPDSLKNLRFVNLRINDTTVTEENKDSFFEIEHDRVEGLVFSGSEKGERH